MLFQCPAYGFFRVQGWVFAGSSGEPQEHLLDLIDRVALRLGLVRVGDAVLHTGADQAKPRALQRPVGGGDLSDEFSTLPTLLLHALDALDLTADATKSLPQVVDDLLGQIHCYTLAPRRPNHDRFAVELPAPRAWPWQRSAGATSPSTCSMWLPQPA